MLKQCLEITARGCCRHVFLVSKWNARHFRPFSSSFSSLYLSFDFFFIMVWLFYLNISNISEDIPRAVPGVSPGRGLLIPHGYLHPGKSEHSEV